MTTEVLVEIVAICGVCMGSLVTAACQFWFQEKPQRKSDEARKKLLLRMLNDPRFKWRKLDHLKHVIGADDETTKRLLLAVGARGSEEDELLWGLIERNPFEEVP